ncbi:hypothetical protein I553_3638 [Mycobacterium xenopi 4042]|uniref:Uncharacterized protein n=1 Tax=Mycobacterium xenopi 4042 TaxID=1299334 RepID=X7ZDJ6_MYCXE|nr:hypothetical protein I553_3638 [Mycobacterium xenopi 4042]
MLFIDEVHRFSKTQQDALLSAVETGGAAGGPTPKTRRFRSWRRCCRGR